VKILKIIVTLLICGIFLALTVWFFKSFYGADVSEFHIKVSAKEFSLDLKTREKSLKQAFAQEQDPQKKAVKQKELDVAQKQIENPEKALKEYEEKAAAAYKALEGLKEEIGKRSLAQAKEALEKGDPSLAEKLFQEVLAKGSTTQKSAGAYHLGALAESRIDYGQANKYYQQAVQLQPDNPLYLIGAGNMSYTLGYYQESETFLKQALKLRENSLNPDDLDVARSLHSLGILYSTQGKYHEAEPLLQRSLDIKKRKLGSENPEIAGNLNSLADLYRRQERYKEAEPLFKEALSTLTKTLWPEYPNGSLKVGNRVFLYVLAPVLDNYALLLKEQGRYVEAIELNRNAIIIWEKIFPPKPLDLACSLQNLAELYRALGRYNEAEPLYKRAISIAEKAGGPEYVNLGICLDNLGALYCAMGKYSDAEPLHRRALPIIQKALGPEHSDVATCLENYAALLKKMGRGAEAAPLEARARAIRAKQAQDNPPK